MDIEVSAVVDGKITGITNFGAFVEIEGGKSGLVHISEVSETYVNDIKDVLSVGQEVKCKVISISPEGKISLSIKKANSNEGKSEKPKTPPQKRSNPNVWKGNEPKKSDEKQSFEDMMASFKKISDDKMSDLKKADSKRGSMGYSRRGKK